MPKKIKYTDSGNAMAKGSRNFFKRKSTKESIKGAYGTTYRIPAAGNKTMKTGNVAGKAAARQTLKKRSVGSKRK